MKKTKINNDIPVISNKISNSILCTNKNIILSEKEKAMIFDYFVISPINLPKISRRFFDLKRIKGIDFTNKKLREELRKIYDYIDNEIFHIISSDDDENLLNIWYENGHFPPIEIISLERICIIDSYSLSKIPALIYFVRNCVCHGNFEVVIIGNNKKYLVLEDNNGKIIRGRGCIEVKKLLLIIETILNFEP